MVSTCYSRLPMHDADTHGHVDLFVHCYCYVIVIVQHDWCSVQSCTSFSRPPQQVLMATMTCLCTILPLLLVIGWLLYNVKLLEATTAGTHGHDDLQLHVRSDASRHLRNLRRKGKCATNQVHRLSASANFFLQYHLVANFFCGATWLPNFCGAT